MDTPVERKSLKNMTMEEKAEYKAAQVRMRMKTYYQRHKEEIALKRRCHYYKKVYGIDLLHVADAELENTTDA